MSKELKRLQLDADTNCPYVARQRKHLKKAFDNFIPECGDATRDRFRTTFNFLSAEDFDYFVKCETYDADIEAFESLHVKIPSKILAHHKVATRKQEAGKSPDECWKN